MRKIPLRKCVATNEQLPKKELIRIVKTPDGAVVVDQTGKMNGRGAYLKLSQDAIQLARRTNALGRSLSVTIPETIYEELLSLVKE